MRLRSVGYWLPFALLILWVAIGCTPQLAELDPLPTNTPEPPTLPPPTEPAVLPTAVAQISESPTDTPLPNTPEPTKTPVATASPIQPPATEPASEDQQEPPKYAVVGVASDDTLNVRDGPGVENEVVGEVPHNGIGIELLGEDIEVDESPWREISYEGLTGWVNRRFLAVQYGEPDDSAAAAHAIITALSEEDWESLAPLVHPEKGVRFSPYTYVRDEDVVLDSGDVATLDNNSALYRWGRFDGTGDYIDFTFADYYARFIFNTNFYQPHTIGFNQFIGWSNTINNIAEYYPEASYVEYHFPGFNPDYDGMDWASLRLIMEEVEGEWKLVGIVHSEWTI